MAAAAPTNGGVRVLRYHHDASPISFGSVTIVDSCLASAAFLASRPIYLAGYNELIRKDKNV